MGYEAYEFGVGTWVRCRATLRRHEVGNNRREWQHSHADFTGVIVGGSRRFDGACSWDYDAGNINLGNTKSHPVYLVIEGFTNKPRVVPVDAVEEVDEPEGGLPMRHAIVQPWSKGERECMREEASKMHRDESGRFVK